MAVQVDGSKCAYIKGECDCSSHGSEMTCNCNCDCHSNGETGCCSSSSGCLGCAEVCPEHAISRMERQIVIDEERCTECGVCMSVCAYDAIYIVK